MKKRPCLICGFPIDADSGYCAKYCSKYSAKFHALNYRMRQKYKAEAETLQPRIHEAPVSELRVVDGTWQLITSEVLIFELSDMVKTLQSKIYEAPGSESDD
ncbi:hypothetical protein C1646_677622 [Rhizophagus diaphanus]|nr:hypothetical protein C1646_677622 [Rhizophagus diaphanus] [Rhizophagus sp. MUCL 43196]